MKLIYDIKSRNVLFQTRDLVLIWDVRREDMSKHGKFDHLWFGPFRIAKVRANKTFMLKNLDGELLQLSINGQCLKHYFQH